MATQGLFPHDFKGQFSGHETFPLRHGWLKKAYDIVANAGHGAGADLFKGPEAIVRFGVGKNMAIAIRHWAIVCGVLQEDRNGPISTTPFGDFLLGPNGVDPYLESLASIWLIHWNLAGTNPSKATTWYWAFNHLPTQQFDRAGITTTLLSIAKERNWNRASASTFKRDVECFVRCYAPKKVKGQITEESIESSLSELSLITPLGASSFRFNRGPHSSLPDAVFAWAVFEYWRKRESSTVLSIEQLTYDPGSPGRVFKLDDSSVADRLMRLSEVTENRATWSDTSGLRQVQIHKDLDDGYAFLASAFPSGRTRGAA